jgi:7-cyano-7-deazaguanine synthase
MKTVLLYSGGLDSTVLLYWLREEGHEVHALGLGYGQRHLRELNAAFTICEKLHVPYEQAGITFPFGGSIIGHFRDNPTGEFVGADTVVPGRNCAFLSLAISRALAIGAGAVAIGAHAGDAQLYADCREEFFVAFERLTWGTYGQPVALLRPFVGMSKATVVALGRKLRVPFDKTWSCYRGATAPCGECGACVERSKALGDYVNQGMSFAKRRRTETVND